MKWKQWLLSNTPIARQTRDKTLIALQWRKHVYQTSAASVIEQQNQYDPITITIDTNTDGVATLAKVAWCSHSWAWQWCLERDDVWNWWESPRNTNGLKSNSLKEPNGNDWCTASTVDLKDSDRITQFPSGLMTRLPYTVSCTSISRRELRDTKQLTARRNWAAAAENRIPSTRGLSTGGGDHVTHIIIRFYWLRNRRSV